MSSDNDVARPEGRAAGAARNSHEHPAHDATVVPFRRPAEGPAADRSPPPLPPAA